ncbi:MAG: amino acid adenylation domain-containing protein, partial [Gammaproteobacteria bacterium]|nr:amino acid adenylation domain-containing protein [Gammaproteobacteria bacterium]
NGKIDRRALPDPDTAFSSGGYEPPRTGAEQQLADIWSAVLKRPDIGIHDNFFDLGGDSILSIQIVARARQAGLGLSPRDVFQHQTLAELAQAVQPLREVIAEQGLIQGEVALTPIQSWFFAGDTSEPWHFNQAMLLEAPVPLDEAALRQALAALLNHHDALRLRYRRTDGVWQQRHSDPEPGIPFHLDTLTDADFAKALNERASHWQAGLNLEHGPLTRLVLFRHEQGPRLLWVIHHLAVDGVSWRILLEDLNTAYRQAHAGETVQLPAKTSSFQTWSERLRQWPAQTAFEADAGYWRQLPALKTQLPIDRPQGRNRVTDTRCHTLALDPETTRRLLEEAPSAYRTGINDLLLSALLLSLHEWSGQRWHAIDLESHGRADLFGDIDLSRTVGWFTALYSVALTLPDSHDPGLIIKSIKEQLRQIPHDGIGCGLLRQQGEALPQGRILFNYLGQFDQTADSSHDGFRLAREDSGDSGSLTGSRDHLIDINGLSVHGRLSLTFSYSGEQYQAATIRRLADIYQKHLQNLIAHCQHHYGYTPSDFPLASIDQNQLDALTAVYQNNIAAIYPLSPMQQGMLFHSLCEPGSGLYFEQFQCRLSGDIHPATLRQAWQYLIDRHPVLRTAFRHDQDSPVQIVLKQADLPWMEDDWRTLTEEERQQEIEQARQQGFDFTQAPLMRLQLIQETPETWRFLWHHHHILMDGWCLPIIFSELFSVYSALRKQQTPRLPPVSRYQNYIAWLVRQDRQAAQSYWQEKLAGFTAPTPVPIARRGLEAARRHHEITRTLTSEETRQFNRFARWQRVTLNTLVQAAWAGLLGRYSGETDIVFGATTSGRNVPLPGIENMVGLFINTLPLRIDLNTDTPALLHSLQAQQQEDSRYAYTSLTDIQSWSQVPGGAALFDSIVVFENYPVDDALNNQQNLPFQISDFQGVEQTNYLLTLAVLPGDRLDFKLSFDRRRIEPQAGTRLLEHLQLLLKGITEQPEAGIQQLPLLTEAETQQLIEWNRTETDYPQDKTIVDLFEEQVEKAPDNIAVVFEGRQLTYAELNRQANQLAHALIVLGVQADTPVGICVERSLEMIVGLLGILKAGGAYVPLDPDYPRERLHFMLEDSQAPVLLTQSFLQERLPELPAKVVCLDEAGAYQKQSGGNPEHRSGSKELAYVIYTSGSTGMPKGVMVTHQSLTNFVQASSKKLYKISTDDNVLQFASFTFDASAEEIYPALTKGAALILRTPDMLNSNENFLKLCASLQITILDLPTAFWQQLLHEKNIESLWPDTVRLVIIGGESAAQSATINWRQKLSHCATLINTYGPTEATVAVSAFILGNAYENLPIGKPIPNIQIHVLDNNHQVQPIGIPGELCIAGAGLARGYLNRPGLTAEKFIEVELFGKLQRIYKTGDLARWLPDGNLEYLGRIDCQVKLRGFRIELGEIEAVLSQHETIKEAVVNLHEREGNPSLAAYVTMFNDQCSMTNETAGSTLNIDNCSLNIELRDWLKARLPDYMVPASFTVLDKLPLTPNGKIDRKALPDPELASDGEGYEAPRNAIEQQLTDIWSAVLKRPGSDIGINDNFFNLGGDSIHSIQVVARARQMGLGITPRDLFQQQSIAKLAQVTRTLHDIIAEQGPVQGDAPLTPIQQQFFGQNFPEYWHYNQSMLLRMPDNINVEALRQAFGILLSHHDALRLRYRSVGGQWVQSFSAPSEKTPFFIEDLRQSQNPPAELQRLTENYQSSLNISDGPLTHLVVFRLAGSARLFWCIHHLAVDGVTWRILLEDLHAAYTQIAAAQSPQLPDKTSSFKTWAERLTVYARTLTDELAYWRALPALPVPVDNPDGKNRLEHTQACTMVLSAEETESLLREVPAVYNTHINDVLLTALALAMADWSGESRCLIDLEGHGRADLFPDIDLSRTAGWFTTVYPVLLTLPADLDSGASLKAVKGQLRLIPHEGIGHGLLTCLDRETLPKGDIVFNYLGQFDQGMEADLFAFADEAVGSDISLKGTRNHLLDINGAIAQGQLSLHWSYSSECYRAETVKALATAYQTRLTALIHHCRIVKRPSLKTLAPLNVHHDRPSGLFCLPGSGSKAGYFRAFAKTLNSALSVYGLESPGLDGHGHIPESVETLAQAHLETIRAVQPHGPYYFIGHSFGVAVAFELAWHLEQAGEQVAMIALFDQGTPQHIPEASPALQDTELDTVWSIVQIIKLLSGMEPPFDLDYLKKTDSFNHACRSVMNWLKQENAQEILFSPQAAPEELCALVKVYRSNIRAFPCYRLQDKRLRCMIDLICAEETIKANTELPEGWGWNEHTVSGVRIHRMAGSHVNMILHPQVRILAKILEDILIHAA